MCSGIWSKMVFFIAKDVCTTNPTGLASGATLARFGTLGFGPHRSTLRLGAAAQRTHFMRRELAHLPGLDVQLKRAVTHALDLLHVMSDLLKHAPDLPVLTFRERYLV